MPFEEFTEETLVKTGTHASKSMNVILDYEKKKEEKNETRQEPEKKMKFKDDVKEEKLTLDSFLKSGRFKEKMQASKY